MLLFMSFITGVAIGAGWQAIVAYVNIACYYIFGTPLGLTMGYILNMGVKVSIFFSPFFSPKIGSDILFYFCSRSTLFHMKDL